MENNKKIEYPCTKCDKPQPCMFRECKEYRMWLRHEWDAIQAAVKKIRKGRRR